MRKRLLLLLLSAAACLPAAGRAEACTCSRPSSPCAAYAGADAVFVGTVTDARGAKAGGKGWARLMARRAFRFAVEQSFSGFEGVGVEVWTGAGDGDCGFPFKRGARYVVYAQRDEETGRLSTSICTRTRPVSAAAEDLELLRGMAAGGPGGTLSGEVLRARRPGGKGDPPAVTRLAEVPVVVEGEGLRRELRTDPWGGFKLFGLRPGNYRVRLTPPEGLNAGRAEHEARVVERGCAPVSFTVSDDGQVGGAVADAEGKPAANVTLTLYEADEPDPPGPEPLYARTDSEGRYLFERVPPGRYRLAVNLTRHPDFRDKTAAFPRTFYPGAAEASGAEVITLAGGERRLGLDWHLPSRRASVPVEIFVVWRDGRPAEKALVTVQVLGYGSSRRQVVETDAQGRFAFEGFEGQTFMVGAQSDLPASARPETVALAEKIQFTLSNPFPPLTLVLRWPR